MIIFRQRVSAMLGVRAAAGFSTQVIRKVIGIGRAFHIRIVCGMKSLWNLSSAGIIRFVHSDDDYHNCGLLYTMTFTFQEREEGTSTKFGGAVAERYHNHHCQRSAR
jgi:hypothetical protein